MLKYNILLQEMTDIIATIVHITSVFQSSGNDKRHH